MKIADLQLGPFAGLQCILDSVREATTRGGKPYVTCVLSDDTGSIPGKLWDTNLAGMGEFKEGSIVLVDGKRDEYQGRPQVVISIVMLAPDQDRKALRPQATLSADDRQSGAEALLLSIRNIDLRNLVASIVLTEEWQTHPAAKRLHHASIGGLAEHSLSMARAAEAMSGFYESLYPRMIDWDLVLAGCLLHDVGKFGELSGDGEYTDEGAYIGHVVLGAERVRRAAECIEGGMDHLQALQHIILSHHGEREKGAPVEPRTIEAVIVNHLDNLDSRIGGFAVLARDAKGAEWMDGGLMFGPGRMKMPARPAPVAPPADDDLPF
jgi:3'-5' exoribonuclease